MFIGSSFNTVTTPVVVEQVPVFVDATPNVVRQDPPQPTGLPRPPKLEVPTADEFNDLPLEYQRQLLVVALNSLESDLSDDANGDDWIDHLQLATLATLLTDSEEASEETTRERMQGVAGVFEEVAANPDFRPVSELWGFRTLNVGLREFASEPIVRTRKQLSFAAKELSKALLEMTSGDRWVDYLRLPTLIAMDDVPDDPQQRLADLDKLTAKFDRVKTDETYEMIAKEESFNFANFALRAYAEELRTSLEPPKPADPLPVAPKPVESNDPASELKLPKIPQPVDDLPNKTDE